MSFAETMLLGAIAGSTIFLGLPLGRVGRVDDRQRVALAMFSVGTLAFIFMDVTSHAQQIVAASLDSFKAHRSSFLQLLGTFALLAARFTVGAARIASVVRRLQPAKPTPPPGAGGATAP